MSSVRPSANASRSLHNPLPCPAPIALCILSRPDRARSRPKCGAAAAAAARQRRRPVQNSLSSLPPHPSICPSSRPLRHAAAAATAPPTSLLCAPYAARAPVRRPSRPHLSIILPLPPCSVSVPVRPPAATTMSWEVGYALAVQCYLPEVALLAPNVAARPTPACTADLADEPLASVFTAIGKVPIQMPSADIFARSLRKAARIAHETRALDAPRLALPNGILFVSF